MKSSTLRELGWILAACVLIAAATSAYVYLVLWIMGAK